MSQEPPVTPFDWQRLFIGQEHWGFYGEIILRSVIMYLGLLLLLRLLSKRALTQMSVLEFGIVIALGSAAGDPTFYADVPIFHGLLALAVIVCFQLLYTRLLQTNESIETAMEGKPVEIIKDACIVEGSLLKARLAQEELFALLRGQSIRQLGELERVYLEQDGQISIFKHAQPQAGLPIVPPWDLEQPFFYEGQVLSADQELACCKCGKRDVYTLKVCTACEHERFMLACLDPLAELNSLQKKNTDKD